MSSARDEILDRVRRALGDVPGDEQPEDVPVSRGYSEHSSEPPGELLTRFAERLSDYRAQVTRVAERDVASEVARLCEQLELRRLVVPCELPDRWRPEAAEVVEDEHLTVQELNAIDAVLTGCAAAIAETGTLVLDGKGASGRRAITLLPDHHICVVRAEQVVGSVPEAIAELAAAVEHEHVPVTLISGPSASSDIELTRVEGVHGPRHLHVVIAE